MKKAKFRVIVAVALMGVLIFFLYQLYPQKGFDHAVRVGIENKNNVDVQVSFCNIKQNFLTEVSCVEYVLGKTCQMNNSVWSESEVKINSDSLAEPYPFSFIVKGKKNKMESISKVNITLKQDKIVVHVE